MVMSFPPNYYACIDASTSRDDVFHFGKFFFIMLTMWRRRQHACTHTLKKNVDFFTNIFSSFSFPHRCLLICGHNRTHAHSFMHLFSFLGSHLHTTTPANMPHTHAAFQRRKKSFVFDFIPHSFPLMPHIHPCSP